MKQIHEINLREISMMSDGTHALGMDITKAVTLPDIVIPIGIESRWYDNELRYALRGIQKYLTGYGNIFLVGGKRKWLKGVTTIPCQEDYSRKQLSIFNKLVAAANCPAVSDPFIMFNDDHFLLKPIDVKDIKYWKFGTLETLAHKSEGTYKRTVINTMNYAKKKGWGNDNFDIHVPISYEKEKLLSLQSEDWEKDHIIKSMYCNKFRIEGTNMKDLVIARPLTRYEIVNAIIDRTFFSINEHGTNEQIKTILQETYPEKSSYEV